jgi:uncharacterized membrane protein
MSSGLDKGRSGRLDWVGRVFALAALVLVPWIVVLVRMLPSEHRAAHWDIAWGGFDIALALLLLAVAVAAWRRSPWLEGAATAAATLLFVDAWFDVLTSSSHGERVVAIVEAVVAELPMAVLCLLIARSAERRLAWPRSQRAQRGSRPRLSSIAASEPFASRSRHAERNAARNVSLSRSGSVKTS